MLYPQVPDNQPKFEIPDAFKVKFEHYFDDVYGAQASIYKALGYCLISRASRFSSVELRQPRKLCSKNQKNVTSPKAGWPELAPSIQSLAFEARFVDRSPREAS